MEIRKYRGSPVGSSASETSNNQSMCGSRQSNRGSWNVGPDSVARLGRNTCSCVRWLGPRSADRTVNSGLKGIPKGRCCNDVGLGAGVPPAQGSCIGAAGKPSGQRIHNWFPGLSSFSHVVETDWHFILSSLWFSASCLSALVVLALNLCT